MAVAVCVVLKLVGFRSNRTSGQVTCAIMLGFVSVLSSLVLTLKVLDITHTALCGSLRWDDKHPDGRASSMAARKERLAMSVSHDVFGGAYAARARRWWDLKCRPLWLVPTAARYPPNYLEEFLGFRRADLTGAPRLEDPFADEGVSSFETS